MLLVSSICTLLRVTIPQCQTSTFDTTATIFVLTQAFNSSLSLSFKHPRSHYYHYSRLSPPLLLSSPHIRKNSYCSRLVTHRPKLYNDPIVPRMPFIPGYSKLDYDEGDNFGVDWVLHYQFKDIGTYWLPTGSSPYHTRLTVTQTLMMPSLNFAPLSAI